MANQSSKSFYESQETEKETSSNTTALHLEPGAQHKDAPAVEDHSKNILDELKQDILNQCVGYMNLNTGDPLYVDLSLSPKEKAKEEAQKVQAFEEGIKHYTESLNNLLSHSYTEEQIEDFKAHLQAQVIHVDEEDLLELPPGLKQLVEKATQLYHSQRDAIKRMIDEELGK